MAGRTSDGLDEDGRPLFSLGRWGLPVNLVAVLYGILMVVNLAWPRAEVYDPAGKGWYLQYSAEIVLALVLVSGVFTFLLLRKNYFASIGHSPRHRRRPDRHRHCRPELAEP